ncbi:MAG: 4-alpha-glucanotransferase [Pseudomonadota bacterium]
MKKSPDARPVLDRRRAGILLHPTSLPGEAENGTLGPHALRFVDFLADSGLSVWQMLPLGPTHADRSPYQCLSVHAGNPRLISFVQLETWGWLPHAAGLSAASGAVRQTLLAQARQACLAQGGARAMQAFDGAHAFWLDDYALYVALRQAHNNHAWWQWPEPLRDRDPTALAAARVRHAEDMALVRFEQFIFFRQWQELRHAAQARGVQLFGDLPIFVAHDSADVWAQRDYFDLDAVGQPRAVAGVPPDYFSPTGQRWGNPLYNWAHLQADGFRWWIERLRTQFSLFDLVRIDHFRGFEACWQIPADEDTAINGRWVSAPGEALFQALQNEFGTLSVVAEDLGLITPAVQRLREQFGLPGMRILQFAFDGGADNPYLPHNHEVNSVVYTGTHDNDTTLAWFEGLPIEQQCTVLDYLGHPGEPMPWPLIRAALASVAQLAILPMQDVLQAGDGNRMNTPGSNNGNWKWRFEWEQLAPGLAAQLWRMAGLYGRGVASSK